MKDGRAPLVERFAGYSAVQRLLSSFGLDSQQFLLFLRLLRTLSERQEFMGNLGVDRFLLAYLALFYAFLVGVPLGLLVFLRLSAPLYLLCDLIVTFVLILMMVVAEAANTLYNPVEASVLAHQPVHSLTYAAAKITHVLMIVLYLVPALSVPPALMGLLLEGASWSWPVTHFTAALFTGLLSAFLVCALYGWLFRLLPPTWLKAVSLWLQACVVGLFPVMGGIAGGLIKSLRGANLEVSRWSWMPLTWFVKLGLLGHTGARWALGWQGLLSIVVTAVVVWFGLRSFSGTYFSEASSLVQGFSHGKRQRGRVRRLAPVIRLLTGAPAGLGAFSFTSQLMRRDWHFRRNSLPMVLYACFILVPLLAKEGFPVSPLVPHKFSFAHIFPHLFGMMLAMPCTMIAFSDMHRGSWIFLTAPLGNLRAFARGVYWALWLPGAALPHLCVLPFLIWFWGWKAALLFACFSLILVSCYIDLELLLISGLPFANPFKASRAALGVPVLVLGMMTAGFVVALQWVVFQIWLVAVLLGAVLAVAAWLIARLTLRQLEGEIRWNLQTLQMGPTQMFKGIE